jgi:hypothetical protein
MVAIRDHGVAGQSHGCPEIRGRVMSEPKRRRAQTMARRREVAVYDGTNLIGTVKIADDGRSTAHDLLGKRVGSFGSLKAASDALSGGGVDG